MIPKTIHYCWFGRNKKPKLAKMCIKSWKKYCPDYEIIEWNENNFDLSQSPLYVRQAYEEKKWAFVTDYVRLKVVYDYGGIYLDTDVQLIKSLDDLLKYKAYFGFEDVKYVATGLGFGAEKSTNIIGDLIKQYQDITFIKNDGTFDLLPCPKRNTAVFIDYGLIPNGKTQFLKGGTMVFSKEYFCPLNFSSHEKNISNNTFSIHWFSKSWHTKQEIKARKKSEKRYDYQCVKSDKGLIYAILYVLKNYYLGDRNA